MTRLASPWADLTPRLSATKQRLVPSSFPDPASRPSRYRLSQHPGASPRRTTIGTTRAVQSRPGSVLPSQAVPARYRLTRYSVSSIPVVTFLSPQAWAGTRR